MGQFGEKIDEMSLVGPLHFRTVAPKELLDTYLVIV
jgi:hypothetical protein